MIQRIKKTDNPGMVLNEIKNKLNGTAPNGFKYFPEVDGEDIILKVEAR